MSDQEAGESNSPEAASSIVYVDAVQGERIPFELKVGQTAQFRVTPGSKWVIKGHSCGAGGHGDPFGPQGANEGSLSVQRRPNWQTIKPEIVKFFRKDDDIIEIEGPGVVRLAAHYVQQGKPDGSSSGSLEVKVIVY